MCVFAWAYVCMCVRVCMCAAFACQNIRQYFRTNKSKKQDKQGKYLSVAKAGLANTL